MYGLGWERGHEDGCGGLRKGSWSVEMGTGMGVVFLGCVDGVNFLLRVGGLIGIVVGRRLYVEVIGCLRVF